MYPSKPNLGKTSQPEFAIFGYLQRQLPDEFVVLHSLRTFDHQSKPVAEADFVVIGPMGVMVIEVKGVFECEAGVWIYADGITKNETPLDQASGCMYAIKDRLVKILTDQGKGELSKKISFGCGFVSTGRDLPRDMVEIPRELFMGPSRIVANPHSCMRDYIATAQAYWLSRNSRAGRLTKEEVVSIGKSLRPDINAPLDALTSLRLMDGKMVEATEQQNAAIRGALANPRLLVEGMAGTGKTLLAINIANKLADSGKRVLFLCFNENLRAYLASSVTDKVTVNTVHKLLLSGTSSDQAQSLLKDSTGDKLWREDMPTVFALINETKEEDKFDTLIVDEAQDVLSTVFLDALSCVVKGGMNDGNVILFYDSKQNIFGGLTEDALRYLALRYFFNYTLTLNCRNSAEVAALGSIISEIDIPLNDELASGQDQNPKFVTKAEIATAVRNFIDNLSASGIPPRDIVILSSKSLENSAVLALSQGPSAILTPWGGQASSFTKAYFSTIHGFKGLEAGAVVIVDIDLETEATRQQLMYVGCTRARSILCPTMPSSNEKAYAALALAYGKRLSRNR